MRCKAFSCCGAQRMSSVLKPLRPSLSVCGTRQKLRLSKQARFLPTTAHTALALDSATGSGQVRVRCHSLRQSTSHNVTFSASGKFHLCLGFSSPHKAGFAGPQIVRHRRRSPHSPESHLRFDSVFIYIQKADTPKGVSAFWCRQPDSNRYGFYSEGF